MGIVVVGAGLAMWPSAWAQDVRVTAQVDHASVKVGQPVTLTVTLEGDLEQLELRPIKLPPELPAIAESRASNFSMQAGTLQRAMILSYTLLPQQPGTYQVGPFEVIHRGQKILTDPVAITVKRQVLPPGRWSATRYTL